MAATSTTSSAAVHPVRSFTDLRKRDVDFAGGKGANLGELTRAGLPLPPGFVIGASYSDLTDGEGDVAVAVRSSATAEDTGVVRRYERDVSGRAR